MTEMKPKVSKMKLDPTRSARSVQRSEGLWKAVAGVGLVLAACLLVAADKPCGDCGTPTGTTMYPFPCVDPCGGWCMQITMPAGLFVECWYNCISRYPCLSGTYTGPVRARQGSCRVPPGSICQCELEGEEYNENVINMPCVYQGQNPCAG